MLDRNALLDLEDDALLHACRQETYRSSGPGGQHRDKTDSAVRLTLEAYDVSVSCSEHRSQHRNRAEALRRLRNALAIEVRMPIGDACGDWQGSLKLGQKDRRYAPSSPMLWMSLLSMIGPLGSPPKGLGSQPENLYEASPIIPKLGTLSIKGAERLAW